jgi:hypothetical protein
MIQIKVMEVTQRLQPVQEKACQLFTEVESQGDRARTGRHHSRKTPRRASE